MTQKKKNAPGMSGNSTGGKDRNPAKETINMNANSIVSETADKWFTCPDWCTLGHKVDGQDVTYDGEPIVGHQCTIHDGPSVTLWKGQTDTLTVNGLEVQKYYLMEVSGGEPTRIDEDNRRIVAADLRLIASIFDGEVL